MLECPCYRQIVIKWGRFDRGFRRLFGSPESVLPSDLLGAPFYSSARRNLKQCLPLTMLARFGAPILVSETFRNLISGLNQLRPTNYENNGSIKSSRDFTNNDRFGNNGDLVAKEVREASETGLYSSPTKMLV